MSANPSVAVLIPAFNAARYIAETIGSVYRQTVLPREIIVVDDGSTDDTASVVEQGFPDVTIIRLPHGGVSIARNAGVEHTTCEWIAIIDADDLWLPHKMECQLAAIRDNPGVDILFAHFDQFTPDGATMPGQGIHISSFMAKVESMRRVGPFRPGLPVSEYLDWMMRARDLGLREFMVPETLVMRRIHGENVGIRDRALRVNYVRTLKEALDRRRGLDAKGS